MARVSSDSESQRFFHRRTLLCGVSLVAFGALGIGLLKRGLPRDPVLRGRIKLSHIAAGCSFGVGGLCCLPRREQVSFENCKLTAKELRSITQSEVYIFDCELDVNDLSLLPQCVKVLFVDMKAEIDSLDWVPSHIQSLVLLNLRIHNLEKLPELEVLLLENCELEGLVDEDASQKLGSVSLIQCSGHEAWLERFEGIVIAEYKPGQSPRPWEGLMNEGGLYVEVPKEAKLLRAKTPARAHVHWLGVDGSGPTTPLSTPACVRRHPKRPPDSTARELFPTAEAGSKAEAP